MIRRIFNSNKLVTRPVKKELNFSKKNVHLTRPNQNPMIYGGLAVAVAAISLQYGLDMYRSSKDQATVNSGATSQPFESVLGDDARVSESTEKDADAEKKSDAQNYSTNSTKEEGKTTAKDQDRKSFFDGWFEKTYYEGGFEEKMSRREAALILGIRESATAERIKEAHRRILLLNHPDRGGSAYVAAKVNEAKDLLLKGKA